MNLKRAFLILIAAMLMPGLAMAQVTLNFAVTKEFTDNNPSSINVTITCNTGIPLTQSADITENDGVVFVVAEIPDVDIVECSITEDGEAGYLGVYSANDVEMSGGCMYDGGFLLDNIDPELNTCEIINTPAPVAVTVTKAWVVAGEGDVLDRSAEVRVWSENEIIGGFECFFGEGNLGDSPSGLDYDGYCADLMFDGNGQRTVMVVPEFGGAWVRLDEEITDSSVDSQNNCGGTVTIYPNQGASCTFTNTIFFEGIPTLNQYGLAILALLMLGVGFVGFRRFV